MRFWLELHCDNIDNIFDGCYNSTSEKEPQGIFGDLRVGRATLERQALSGGWKKVTRPGEGAKLFCPSCVQKGKHTKRT